MKAQKAYDMLFGVIVLAIAAFYTVMTCMIPLRDNADVIKTEVMADFITIGQMKGFTKEWNINGETVVLGVEKLMQA